MQPHRRQPPGLPGPWDSPAKNTGVGCHFLLRCMKVKSETEVTQSCPTLSDPMTAAHQAPPSMGFCRQEYWSGVPLPSPSTSISLPKYPLLKPTFNFLVPKIFISSRCRIVHLLFSLIFVTPTGCLVSLVTLFFK